MTPAALLDRCRALDIRLRAEGDRLRFDAPAGALDPMLRANLAANRAAILEMLRREEADELWARLASLRWGPALGDPTPGIVVPARHPPGATPLDAIDTPVAHANEWPELSPPRRTPWGTWIRSAADAPPIEAFGPAPPFEERS